MEKEKVKKSRSGACMYLLITQIDGIPENIDVFETEKSARENMERKWKEAVLEATNTTYEDLGFKSEEAYFAARPATVVNHVKDYDEESFFPEYGKCCCKIDNFTYSSSFGFAVKEFNPKEIEVATPFGKMRAELGGDDDYPEIFTYLRREDGTEIDLVAATYNKEKEEFHGLVYGDPYDECYTEDYEWSGSGLLTIDD